jgi:SAM-dependent methyltransferase
VNGPAERARWEASGSAWDRWADPMAALADKLNHPLLDAAGVVAGDRVLDLASGAGEPALSAARRVGPSGLVVGLDFVPAMLAGAIRRAAAAPGPAPLFLAADMMALPFPPASFDRATCRFGIMFVPAAVAALADLRRVLRPGGRIALMVWGARAGNALFDVVGAAVDARFGAGPAAGLDTLFRFAAPGSLAAALTAAGFAGVGETAVQAVRKAPMGEPFWRATLEMTCGPRLAGLPVGERACLAPGLDTSLDADIARRFAARAVEGAVALPLSVRIGTGEVPTQ